jgi:Leucine-rich repeat (LRR) protein
MKNKSINKILKWFKNMENEEYHFPKTKKELFKLERLDLCCFCQKIPKEISQIKNIKKLTINVGGIRGTLPKEIKYFKHLEELNLGLTFLEKLHPNLYKLKKLKKLDLAGNFFNDIPKGISNLKNLEELDLGLYCGTLPKDIVQLKKLNIINNLSNF